MKRRGSNYSSDGTTDENYNLDEKYSITGESAFSRNMSLAFDNMDEFFMNNFDDGFNKRLVDFTNSGQVNYIRPDVRIMEDAVEALTISPDVTSTEIEISVEDGVLTLEGEVENLHEKQFSERLVGLVPGVISVNNLLAIRAVS